MIAVCTKYGIGLFPHRPLAAGALRGTHRRGSDASTGSSAAEAGPSRGTQNRREALEGFASERGLSLLDVAIGGLAALPSLASVMVGARTADQIRANAAAARWIPTATELQALLVATGDAVESGTYARSAPQ